MDSNYVASKSAVKYLHIISVCLFFVRQSCLGHKLDSRSDVDILFQAVLIFLFFTCIVSHVSL